MFWSTLTYYVIMYTHTPVCVCERQTDRDRDRETENQSMYMCVQMYMPILIRKDQKGFWCPL